MAILPRRPRRDGLITDAQRSHATNEYLAVAGISITDQMVGCWLPAAGFRELIGEPLCRRMRGHAKPQDPPPAVPHDQQPVEQPERDGRHHEQVHRRDPIRMIAKKGLPALRWRSPPPRHVFGHAGLPDVDSKLEQFAMDPRRSPQRIGKAHRADQLSDLRRNRRTTRSAPRFPAPVRSETCPVPSQDRLRPNHGQRVTRVRKQPADPSQHQPVDGPHGRSGWPASAQHDDLLTQHQNLSFQCRSRPEQIDDECPNQPDEVRHRRSVARFSATCQPDLIYDRHTGHNGLAGGLVGGRSAFYNWVVSVCFLMACSGSFYS